MSKVIHLAVGGRQHWWGRGWHTACGKQYPEKEGGEGVNVTEDKDAVTCRSCRMSIHYVCPVCFMPPRVGCICKDELDKEEE